jgi:hypothetical protein
MAHVITGKNIGIFRLATLISGAKLEAKGLKMSRGASCYAILKRELGIKGNREKVIAQAEEIKANVANW